MISIDEPRPAKRMALFNLGFRVFFAAAGATALISIVIWSGILFFGWPSLQLSIAPSQWHAHEMIYGYGLAVVAGFLLTAVRNWTGLPTPQDLPLAMISLFWLLARILPFIPGQLNLWAAACFDLLFLVGVLLGIVVPIVKAKQKRQLGIVLCLLFLFSSHSLFYLGALGLVDNGIQQGLYSGFYLIIGLILILGGRVIPFFTERGIGYPVTLKKWPVIEVLSLGFFVVFWIIESLLSLPLISASLALLLCALHSVRLYGWWTHGILHKPLLWVLWLAYLSIIAGFALKAASYWLGVSPFLYIHAFGYGGIGLITVGMMCRVSLGHTGRSVQQPPQAVNWIFTLLALGLACRVAGPLLLPALYNSWLMASAGFWIIGFGIFCWVYIPFLAQPRADGKDG
jgi:uncharacterized protein involved in response to NO